MRKIPTLFEREYVNGKSVGVIPTVKPGLEWVLNGEGYATLKADGSCCRFVDGVVYKRYDAKKGKKPPEGAIPCQPEPDPVTGHWPHWLKCDPDNPADKWFISALMFHNEWVAPCFSDRTYEAIGPHFNGNPYHLANDTLYLHGSILLTTVPRTFEGIREYLESHEIEGIVFWKDDEPRCKIKRSDFGLQWPVDDPDFHLMLLAGGGRQ